ncbi:MAG: YkvA family protein [Sphaerochaetaceae bacterium]|nr:YkvA family protein [Sphaerochaetaceae bacterium]
MGRMPKSTKLRLTEKKRELAIAKAQKMGETATPEKVSEVQDKLPLMRRGPIAKIWDKVQALWEAWKSPDTPMGTKIMIIGCLVYLVSPIDVIPDVLVGIGLLDDAAVLVWGYSMLEKLWKNGGRQAVSAVGGAVAGATVGAVAGGVAGAAGGLYATDEKIRGKINEFVEEKLGGPVRGLLFDILKKELQGTRRKMFSNSLLNLVLYLLAVVLLLEPIFGVAASSCLSALLLLTAFGFSIYRSIRAVGRALPVLRSVSQEKGVRKGISEYLRIRYQKVSLALDIGDRFNILGGEPSGHTLEKLMDIVFRGFFHNLVRFVLVCAVLVGSFFIVRFSLLHVVVDASFWQVVCYPFALASDSLFHTTFLMSLGI